LLLVMMFLLLCNQKRWDSGVDASVARAVGSMGGADSDTVVGPADELDPLGMTSATIMGRQFTTPMAHKDPEGGLLLLLVSSLSAALSFCGTTVTCASCTILVGLRCCGASSTM
jgi:hypothetical protein